MKNFRMNHKLVSLILASGITLGTLTGCGSETVRIQALEEQVATLQQELEELKGSLEVEEIEEVSNEINQVEDEKQQSEETTSILPQTNVQEDYEISTKNVIALVSENRTLFVRYQDVWNDYVTDIFTGAKYHFQYKNQYAGDIQQLGKRQVFLVGELFSQINIGEIVPELLSRATDSAPASLLKSAYMSFNGNATMELATSNDLIDISNVFALSNGTNTLFVRYQDVSDGCVTDIFTGAKYHFQNTNQYAENIRELGKYQVYLQGELYTSIPLAFYPDVIANVQEQQVSMGFLKKIFMKLNNIDTSYVSTTNERLIDIQKLMALENDNLTLYVSYDNIWDGIVKDVFTETTYEFLNTNQYAESVFQLGKYSVKIFSECYEVKPLALEPMIVGNVKDFQIPYEILYSSYLATNGMSAEQIETSKQLILK